MHVAYAYREMDFYYYYYYSDDVQVDRKVVTGDWKKKLDAIQSKAAEEAKLLPRGFLTGMGNSIVQSGRYIYIYIS